MSRKRAKRRLDLCETKIMDGVVYKRLVDAESVIDGIDGEDGLLDKVIERVGMLCGCKACLDFGDGGERALIEVRAIFRSVREPMERRMTPGCKDDNSLWYAIGRLGERIAKLERGE